MSASRARTKLGWLAAGAEALGHETIRLRSLAELRAADDLPLVIFQQYTFGLGGDQLPEFIDLAQQPGRRWVQWIIDLLDRDPTQTLEN